jgi:hypothetical protein
LNNNHVQFSGTYDVPQNISRAPVGDSLVVIAARA